VAGVKGLSGRHHFLLVDRAFLTFRGGEAYLPVGVVYRDKDKGVDLVEFAEEADSGAWRAWVPLADFLDGETAA
jgi:hypothetical protein